MILKAGEMFRRFRILEKAGEGGMGVVYRAHSWSTPDNAPGGGHHLPTDGDVVLKVAGAINRFVDEGEER